MKLQGKVALITGSSSGIGQAIALLFAQEGARIVINCKSSIEKGEQVIKTIREKGGEAILVPGDVSDPLVVEKLFEKTVAAYGTVDILINNAGAARATPFLETTKDQWLEAFNDNLFSTVLCSRRAAEIMLKNKKGKILNTASIRGLESTGREGIMAYSAAKAAVINFTKTLAKELAPHINVNGVAPGFVLTPAFDITPEDTKARYIGNSYLKRWIQPHEIAEAFLYLATADAVTGEILVVDAGFTLKAD